MSLKMKSILIIVSCLSLIYCDKHCRKQNRRTRFFKLKSCHKSTLPVIYWTYADNIEECTTIAVQKSGLALNFSPIEARKLTNNVLIPCQILGCPETASTNSLIEDILFDYYSAYDNITAANSICIKSVGVFAFFPEKQNYIKSINLCQNHGADLADISSESRTKYLSLLINDTIKSWYKVAYVGLDDIDQEGYFVNSFGVPLRCSYYRSWAPGHPISDTKNHNCVVLDDNKMWRVVNCKRNMPVLCEFYPAQTKPNICRQIKDSARRRKCTKEQHKLEALTKNLSREEQCILINN